MKDVTRIKNDHLMSIKSLNKYFQQEKSNQQPISKVIREEYYHVLNKRIVEYLLFFNFNISDVITRPSLFRSNTQFQQNTP